MGGMKGKRAQQELVIYHDAKSDVKLRADADKETVWASLDQIARLFAVQKAAISRHFKNIFNVGELFRPTTVSKMGTVQTEGGRSMRRQKDALITLVTNLLA